MGQEYGQETGFAAADGLHDFGDINKIVESYEKLMELDERPDQAITRWTDAGGNNVLKTRLTAFDESDYVTPFLNNNFAIQGRFYSFSTKEYSSNQLVGELLKLVGNYNNISYDAMGQKNVLQNNANFNETYLTCLPKILDPSTDEEHNFQISSQISLILIGVDGFMTNILVFTKLWYKTEN